jgi:UDP-galactopyranose mutase
MQQAPVVAYPQVVGYTRITEYKKIPIQNVKGTSYAIEYSVPYVSDSNMEPYYPLLTEDSQTLYKKYEAKANEINNMVYCGRLADFKYYNMDQALERALAVVNSQKVKRILA